MEKYFIEEEASDTELGEEPSPQPLLFSKERASDRNFLKQPPILDPAINDPINVDELFECGALLVDQFNRSSLPAVVTPPSLRVQEADEDELIGRVHPGHAHKSYGTTNSKLHKLANHMIPHTLVASSLIV